MTHIARALPGMTTDATAPLKLLLVEGNAADARLLRALLAEARLSPLAVSHAERLDEAFEHLRRERFGIIVLDLNLTDSAGLETLAQVQREAPETPILVLTDRAVAAVREVGNPQGAITQILALQEDLTERYLAAEAVRRSEERFRTIVEHASDVIALIDRTGQIIYATAALKRPLGYAFGELTGRSALDLVHPDSRAVAEQMLRDVTIGPEQMARGDLRVRHKDGSWRHVEVVAVSHLEHPMIEAVVVTYHDVTDRVLAEAALRESESRFRQMAEHIEEAFFLVEIGTWRRLYVSPMWGEIWGRPLADAYDPEAWLGAVHPSDRESFLACRAKVAAGEAVTTHFRVQRPDGSDRWVRSRAFPVRDDGGHVYRLVGVAEDVTELRRIGEQGAQAQKMEAVGRLAGGLAHDFNNLLTVIQGEAELSQRFLPSDHPSHEGLAAITRATGRAAALTRQLLAFSRREEVVEPTVFPLNVAVSDTVRMLRRLIGEDIRVVVRLAMDAGGVQADRGQVEQVLTNLVVNARDAMPGGGTLTIQTRNVGLGDEYVRALPGVSPGRHVLLSVADSGIGMSPEVKARAFEPFFTTKEPGRGTGLGLATCYAIVKQAGGHIAIYSEEGTGTTVSVYFPRVDQAGADASTSEGEEVRGGGETILLVEDEPAVRKIAVRLLEKLGYRVLEAQDAAAALELMERTTETIHLLFIDVVLPGMGGRELADEVRNRRPGIKVLFASGYSEDVILQHQLLHRDVALAQKPFTLESLALRVRAALDR